MRLAHFYSGLVAFLLILLMLNEPVGAASEVLSPGEILTRTVHVTNGEDINCTWVATFTQGAFGPALVTFAVFDPSGDEILNYTSQSLTRTIFTDTSGDYRLRWTNIQSDSVTLTYYINSFPGFDEVDDFIDATLLAVMIGVVILVAVVIIIIVVVLGSEKKRKEEVPAPPLYPAPGFQQPVGMPGKCPMCGRDVESQGTFCPTCGARLK